MCDYCEFNKDLKKDLMIDLEKNGFVNETYFDIEKIKLFYQNQLQFLNKESTAFKASIEFKEKLKLVDIKF